MTGGPVSRADAGIQPNAVTIQPCVEFYQMCAVVRRVNVPKKRNRSPLRSHERVFATNDEEVELGEERELEGENMFGIISGGEFFAMAPADTLKEFA